MSMLKNTMVGVAALGTVLASTAASAEPVRAAAATPGVITAKKLKNLRTVAPTSRESRELSGTDIGLGLLAGVAVGVGVYEATKSDSNGG